MPKQKTVQARVWQVTDFKRSKAGSEIKADPRVRYVMWGNEICPETKREHRQAMIGFFKKQSKRVVQTLFGDKVHCEPAQSEFGLHKYNAKGGNVESWGEPVKKGARTDIQAAVDIAKAADGKVSKIIEQAPLEFVKYHAGLTKVAKHYETKPNWREVHVEIHWGKTGTGKSHYPMCVHGAEQVFRWNKASYPWIDGYEGQAVLLIDEFAPEWIPFTELLNVLDGHSLQLPIKGGFVQARWTTVYITAQRHPKDWYAKANIPPESWRAFMRRVAKCIQYEERRMCEHVERKDEQQREKPRYPRYPRLL